MKITHVYMRLSGAEFATGWFGDKPQERVGTLTATDVLEEIRYTTLTEDPAGSVEILTPYEECIPRFQEVLTKGNVDLSRVGYIHLFPIEKEITVPAAAAHSMSNGKDTINVLAKATRKKKVKQERRLHLGNSQNVQFVSAIIKDSNTKLVKFLEGEHCQAPCRLLVILDPNEDEGDLDGLPQLSKQCPNLDVVIFHRYCNKWGVVVEGDAVDLENLWDTQSQVETEPDAPWVIEKIAYVGESTWFGALPKQGKTWIMLCVVKALLTGKPLFSDARLAVPHPSKRVIYLVPEAGRGSVKKRLKMLGLVDHLYDPKTNPEGRLFVRTLSMGQKIPLTHPELLKLAKGADVFIDTAVRYLEGDENAVKDVKVLTENILNLLSVGARSTWIAHHAPKGFENASSMTLGNMFRGSGEFGAALTNAYGVVQEEEELNKVRFHTITGRDLPEFLPDMILQGRPYLQEKGNFKVINEHAEPYNGKPGPKADSLKQEKIDFAKSVEGSYQEKAAAVNTKFGSNHDKRTIQRWVQETEFDFSKGEQK